MSISAFVDRAKFDRDRSSVDRREAASETNDVFAVDAAIGETLAFWRLDGAVEVV